eukprot:TRINITY_DN5239_c0_g1::TRINITY_DN5239_c0_g1_i1::g.23406::m.23406 TRINITY_DN5239_c0_g1::TRINITY_DN5239_c0_g1_i1::g.23406  ORF type:complete len:337 (+),score=60.90,sp/P58802/TB10A_MOUSE/44.58/3e-62,RabGAP-TBC/PF00566.13/3.7e-47 TRINITY_DN5239_c0_g1_i1:408-1418(+)
MDNELSLPGQTNTFTPHKENELDTSSQRSDADHLPVPKHKRLTLTDEEVNAVKRASYRAGATTQTAAVHATDGILLDEEWNLHDERGLDPDVPLHIALRREQKWNDMMDNWLSWIQHRPHVVRKRVWKGIPARCRRRAWQLLSGSAALLKLNKGVFHALASSGNSVQTDRITVDLPRTFPDRPAFREPGGYGQRALYSVLKAYTLHNPPVGYVQSMNFVAALFLLYMPPEEAFWLLVVVNEKYLLGYHAEDLQQLRVDTLIFEALLQQSNGRVARHLKENNMSGLAYTPQWFMCVFMLNLPWHVSLRFWDAFLYEGVKFLFRAGLTIINVCQKDIL